MSVWYGTSKSGTTGSPNLSSSTFSLSSLPIGTDGSIIFGIVIMISLIFSSTTFSLSLNSSIRSADAVTCFFTSSASSFLPCPIKAPICLDNLLRSARSAWTSCLISRFSLSSSITSSTKGNLRSWNLFLMFCFTTSGFSLKNLISNIFSSNYLLIHFSNVNFSSFDNATFEAPFLISFA